MMHRWLPMVLFALTTPCLLHAADGPVQGSRKIPVILDTDIGDDIDDTWALAMLLRSPEVDVKLVVGDYYKAQYRAKLIAKLLTAAGRTDIPVGIGLKRGNEGGAQSKWIEGYDLKSYAGKVHEDGVQAIIDTIMASKEPVTLIAIGPLPNVAEALKRQPEIAKKARLVGMHGSVRMGYGGNARKIDAEYNVKCDAKACQAAFTAAWEITITPLDTCGIVHLRGPKYAKVRDSKDPLAAAVIANYRIWAEHNKNARQADSASSTLFDCVAIYLAFSTDLLTMERLGIWVTDDGLTLIDPQRKPMNVATKWKDMGAFEDLMVERITGSAAK